MMVLPIIITCLLALTPAPPPCSVANPDAVVIAGRARFTVLTSRLIRMEWSEDGVFEDNSTLGVINRRLDVPAYKKSVSRNSLTIRTADLTLTYKGQEEFGKDNLSVEFKMNDKRFPKGLREVRWTPGSDDSGNLMGTFRTLDGCKGFEQINSHGEAYEKGILSRDGWAIVDESGRHLIVRDDSSWGGWVACRPPGRRIDWYIFAYGHDYKAALYDFTRIAGRIPLPPKYTFGYWWSRYWQYSDFEILDLAGELRSNDIPVDVMIIDMDWHDTWSLKSFKHTPKDEFGEPIGWTGYSWQKELFPDPEYSLSRLHEMHFKTALNLHPASGIQPYEDCYDSFVKDYLSRTSDYDGPAGYRYHEGDSLIYLKSNPTTRSCRTASQGERCPVPFRIDQKEWADAYFHSVIHPLEKQGVDFWWLDWQQWKTSEYVPGLSNTFWLNYTFWNDKARRVSDAGERADRPLIYHRWGGLGSHRYQIGFSGDCYDTWEVLRFLPYFTATSSNVCYAYWGHDIGGHIKLKNTDPYKPEVYTRWLQYGVFTPVFKTHSSKNAQIERRIWNYPEQYSRPMREAVRLRYSLSPYIYDAARQSYDSGVSVCRPMYYDWPENEEAYSMKEQYMFGDIILSTVVCAPADPDTGLAARDVWFPPGCDWYDMSTGMRYDGGQTLSLQYTLDENPWYVKAGAILPMADKDIESLQQKSNKLRLLVAPGDGASEYIHYEDDGISMAYCRDYTTTLVRKDSSPRMCRVEVDARKGSYEGMEETRCIQIVLEGCPVPSDVRVDGTVIAFSRFPEKESEAASWRYCGKDLAIEITLPEMPASRAVSIECHYPDSIRRDHLCGKKGLFHRMMRLTPEMKKMYNSSVNSFQLLSRPFLKIAQCASRIDANPSSMAQYIDEIDMDALENDLLGEVRAIRESDAPTEKKERKISAILKSLERILAQSKF